MYALSSCGDLLASPCLVVKLVYNGNCLFSDLSKSSWEKSSATLYRPSGRNGSGAGSIPARELIVAFFTNAPGWVCKMFSIYKIVQLLVILSETY